MTKARQNRFLKLYKPVHDRFEKFCRARAYYDMPYEDLINETLLVAFRKIDDLKEESAFLPFLIGISKRLLSNARKKKKAGSMPDETLLQAYPDPDDAFRRQTEADFLYQALARLPELQREAIILFEITGFSIKEIMEIQNSGASAVKQRLARGRKELARIVKNELSTKEGGML